MKILIIYDSQFGNTERIAQVIADTLSEFGQAKAVHVDKIKFPELEKVDLLILGCPTQGWRPTPAMQQFLKNIFLFRLNDLSVAAFDTRFRMPRWLTGSAAKIIAKKLQEMGGSLLLPPESFFVKGTEGPLREGEIERAATWAYLVFNKIMAARPALSYA